MHPSTREAVRAVVDEAIGTLARHGYAWSDERAHVGWVGRLEKRFDRVIEGSAPSELGEALRVCAGEWALDAVEGGALVQRVSRIRRARERSRP